MLYIYIHEKAVGLPNLRLRVYRFKRYVILAFRDDGKFGEVLKYVCGPGSSVGIGTGGGHL